MINKAIITDIFFDLDHTLYDFEQNANLAFLKIFHENNWPKYDAFIKAFKPINERYWELLTEKKITHDQLRIGRLSDTFDEINFSQNMENIKNVSNKFIDYLPTFNHLIKDTENVLKYLNENYRLHILSNGPKEVQFRKLKNANILNYFKTITTGDDADAKKPDEKIYRYALNLAKISPENALMIGDHLACDVLGAKSVGMQAIWYNPENVACNENQTIITIQNLIELKQIL